MAQKPYSPAAERNCGPILDVLRHVLSGFERVLEIGTGTGQHAVTFGAALPGVRWQTSDLVENHAGIDAWLAEARLANVDGPIVLDVTTAQPADHRYDAVYSANTAHIMSLSAVRRMFGLAATALDPGGIFCLYGPFRDNGVFNAESNAEFDRSLRLRDASMGIRDTEDLEEFAREAGLCLERRYAMPANNELLVWRKRAPVRED